jgi:rubrerythrin
LAANAVSRTAANLAHAFCNETRDARRYLALAAVAERDGHDRLAALFRSLAQRRDANAEGHLDALSAHDESGDADTADNLRTAIAGALHDDADLYPGMARTARDEGFDDIADWFETVAKSRRSHAQRFQRVLDRLTQSSVVGFGTLDSISAKCGPR